MAVLQNLSCVPGSEAALCSAGAVSALLEALRGGSEEAQVGPELCSVSLGLHQRFSTYLTLLLASLTSPHRSAPCTPWATWPWPSHPIRPWSSPRLSPASPHSAAPIRADMTRTRPHPRPWYGGRASLRRMCTA